MKHPTIDRLALYAGGDLSPVTRMATDWHVRKCGQCQQEVNVFRTAAKDARSAVGELPAGVNWDSLAAEMRANIHLGLEASEAISAYAPMRNGEAPQGMSWRMALVAAGFVVLLSIGYWVNAAKKSERMAALRAPEPVVVEASPRAVGLLDGNKGLELQGPAGAQQSGIISVSTGGAAAARYIDEETGQITVNHVYLE